MRPLDSARAALAGAIVMLLGIWMMGVEQSQTGWNTQDVVFAVLAMLAVALLLVGVDIRRRGGGDGG